MFSKENVIGYSGSIDESMPYLRFTSFEQNDFSVAASEQSMFIVYAEKEKTGTVLDFWMAANYMIYKNENGSVDFNSFLVEIKDTDFEYKSISVEQAASIFSGKASGLKDNSEFPIQETVISAMSMTDDWDEKEILAETRNYYFLFQWETSA